MNKKVLFIILLFTNNSLKFHSVYLFSNFLLFTAGDLFGAPISEDEDDALFARGSGFFSSRPKLFDDLEDTNKSLWGSESQETCKLCILLSALEYKCTMEDICSILFFVTTA